MVRDSQHHRGAGACPRPIKARLEGKSLSGQLLAEQELTFHSQPKTEAVKSSGYWFCYQASIGGIMAGSPFSIFRRNMKDKAGKTVVKYCARFFDDDGNIVATKTLAAVTMMLIPCLQNGSFGYLHRECGS